ncbi:MAG TPA: hypothetical protein VJT73_17605 [Polyangiaceae bacterium]|nr:hypothetical protein [Polyangiaceae bacterium]
MSLRISICRLFARLLAVLAVLSVGVRVQFPVVAGPAPVSSFRQTTVLEAVSEIPKAPERTEPRVAPAPFLERLPAPLSPLLRFEPGEHLRGCSREELTYARSMLDELPSVRRTPRPRSDDPPRA